jgi:hypothetical protein
VQTQHFELAEQLLMQHGVAFGLRTLDSLHLAIALDIQRKYALDDFVAADRKLLGVAAKLGLTVIDPEAEPAACLSLSPRETHPN